MSVRSDALRMVGFDAEIMGGLADGHGGGPCQYLRERAVVGGVEMLHEDEAEAGVGLKVLQQLREGLKAAGGSANTDDGNWPAGV